jgi:hypothetical protein
MVLLFKDVMDRAAELRRSLAIYRMVFGPPRQEDPVRYLLARVPQEKGQRLRIAVNAAAMIGPLPQSSAQRLVQR